MKALNKFVDQLARNAAKQPGWVPLVILCYLVLPFAELPSTIRLFGRVLEVSGELLVGVFTLVFFMVGDALDKGIYKSLENRLPPEALSAARDAARSTLQIHDGLYDVVKALATAAGSFQRFSIQFLNETAKFLRSLVLPAVVLGFGLALTGRPLFAACLIVAAGLLVPLYARLKAIHIRHLYDLVPRLKSDHRCQIEDVGAVRLFFWDGTLVGSALLSVQAPANTRLHPAAAVEVAN